jgi:membrane protein YqaA with SNARE-associated domain
MPQDSQKPKSSDRNRARFASLWKILLLETVAIAALIMGVRWFINSHEEGWPLAELLLDPGLWLVVAIASTLGVLGNLALYQLGQSGTQAVFERFPGLDGERWERIGAYYHRYGAKILILSAIPGLGTLLTTGAGAFDIQRRAFMLWVFLGKLLRNWVLLLLFSLLSRSWFS